MASKKSKATKAGGTVMAARSSPYVQRLVNDPELRDNIRTAFDSAREALDRLSNGKTPAKVVFDDKKFHKQVQQASEALRDASVALREGDKPKKKKRKRRGGGMLLLVLLSAGAALAVSEGLRNKVLDALFGKEEEFDYTSTTAPAAPPPPPPAPPEPAETPSSSGS